MPRLHVPTAQHLARNWNADPDRICKNLVRLALSPPNFNYALLFRLARDMLVFNQPYGDIVAAVHRIGRKDLRAKFLEILPLLRDHFEGVNPDYFEDVEPRMYSVGRGLLVPFAPPFIYGVGGQLYFPWLSFWRSNPLADERLSLFVTIVEQVLLNDPDLETAVFQIVDFSAPASASSRELRVIQATDIPRLTDARLREMLDAFAEGYFRAQDALARVPTPPKASAETPPVDDDQDDLFDDLGDA
jgi:hypothetical protein